MSNPLQDLMRRSKEYSAYYRECKSEGTEPKKFHEWTDVPPEDLSFDQISLIECKPRFLYLLKSRNLATGVFDPESTWPGNVQNGGFIGIRTKFGNRFLDTEYHYELGPPFGTAHALKELEEMPKHIILKERSGIVFDQKTERAVAFDKPVSEGGNGWYFADTMEPSTEIVTTTVPNKKLFEYLDDAGCRFREVFG